jgi:hypothetical protein
MSGWPICSARFNGTRGDVALTQAKTASQREDAMRQFNEAIPVHFPMLMADMGGMSEKAFRPWPVRIHIFEMSTAKLCLAWARCRTVLLILMS